jgi:hypothetical protein
MLTGNASILPATDGSRQELARSMPAWLRSSPAIGVGLPASQVIQWAYPRFAGLDLARCATADPFVSSAVGSMWVVGVGGIPPQGQK